VPSPLKRARLTLPRIASLEAFSHKGFGAVWAGALVSNVGTWMETLAVGVYVTEATGRAAATGGVAALMYLPSVVLSPLGGALADRFERRRYLAVGTTVQTLLAGALAALAFTGSLSVAAVSLIAFLMGCANTLTHPAFSALLGELVPQRALHSAFSLNSAQYNLGRIIGPALAAVALAAGGPAWCFLLNTVSFGAVLVALAVVRPPPHEGAPAREGLLEGIRTGVRASLSDPGIRLALECTLWVALLVAPFIGLVPVFALRVFGQGAPAAALLVTSQGVGAVLAALAVGTLGERLGRRRVLVGAVLLLGPVAAAYWLAPTLHLAAAAILVLGAVYLTVLTGVHTVAQSRAPRHLQARVASLSSMLLGGGYAAGLVVQGWLADLVGVRPVTATAALLLLGVAAWGVWRERERLGVLEDVGTLHGHAAPGAAPASSGGTAD
jgi:MFS family permease